MTEPTTLILVTGTWGGTWAQQGSMFRLLLASERIRVPECFEWSGDVSGVPSLTANGRHSDWRAGAASLTYFLRGFPYEQRNVLCHSHGGQLAAYAAAEKDCWIRRLLTISTPVRSDMLPVWVQAKPNIGHWTHVASKRGDWMLRLGEMFDGGWGWRRTMPSADCNILIPRIGHSGLLTDRDHFHHWPSLLSTIKQGDLQMGARHVVR